VASKTARQRKLERERAQRRMARQAHRTRRRRQVTAGVSAGLAVVLIALGVTWALGGFKPDAPSNVISGTCTWTLKDLSADPNLTSVGHPPATGERREGTETMTIKTDQGDIQVEMDLAQTPCTAASFAYLSQKAFISASPCHRLSLLQKYLACGDPRGEGSGGPDYTFADEYLPTEPINGSTASPSPSPSPSSSAGPSPVYYAKGTVVLANHGADTNGSQFYIVYDDGSTLGPAYSIIGTVVKGLDIVERVAKGGAVDQEAKPAPEGKPKTPLVIQSITVGSPGASPSATPSASPTPSAQS
jgi:peptidyl-prolyl cis-trans isomerase B (cyclophilin B)